MTMRRLSSGRQPGVGRSAAYCGLQPCNPAAPAKGSGGGQDRPGELAPQRRGFTAPPWAQQQSQSSRKRGAGLDSLKTRSNGHPSCTSLQSLCVHDIKSDMRCAQTP